MPDALRFLILTAAGWVNRHQEDVIDYLREENRVLREHLGPRPLRLTDAQRVDSRGEARNSAGGCWRRAPASSRLTRFSAGTGRLIAPSFEASKQRYGSPRVHEDLLEQDEYVSRKRVVRLMQEDGLKARLRKRYKLTTMSDHDQPVAANLLDRQFEADAPNQRWVGDTTEFVIGGSEKLYFAAILDLFSRFIVGWAVSAVNDRHLTIKALQMALKRRYPDAGLLHHSDQGCQGRSKIRPPWRRKTRPSGRGVAWLKAAVRRRGQDAGAAAGGRAFLLCSRR